MTKEDKMKEAQKWLDKGIQLEEEGKSKSLVDKCVEKAVLYEKEANSL